MNSAKISDITKRKTLQGNFQRIDEKIWSKICFEDLSGVWAPFSSSFLKSVLN